MRTLLVVPGNCDTLGGALVSLSMLILGFEQLHQVDRLRVLMRSGSPMEEYLRSLGQEECLQTVPARDQTQFFKESLLWVNQQPEQNPLLLDNCVYNYLLPTFLMQVPRLRLSRRPIYHFCHDLALTHNQLGHFARKVIFWGLAPNVLCNSRFTSTHVRQLMPNIRGILYQPIDTARFNDHSVSDPPAALKPILAKGDRIILTPSRISQPGIINDKNLRALIPMLAHLKAIGHRYHGVIIGEDSAADRRNTNALLESAAAAGIADRFSILPPTIAIEDYYKHAAAVVTLAPREPFGRTVVEALACGVPVIGSNTGGIGEILSHFAPQWMVAPQEPIAAAEAIVRTVNQPDTAELLVRAKAWVQAECTAEGYAKKMMDFTELNLPNPESVQARSNVTGISLS